MKHRITQVEYVVPAEISDEVYDMLEKRVKAFELQCVCDFCQKERNGTSKEETEAS